MFKSVRLLLKATSVSSVTKEGLEGDGLSNIILHLVYTIQKKVKCHLVQLNFLHLLNTLTLRVATCTLREPTL